jgi:hypothetical protein
MEAASFPETSYIFTSLRGVETQYTSAFYMYRFEKLKSQLAGGTDKEKYCRRTKFYSNL